MSLAALEHMRGPVRQAALWVAIALLIATNIVTSQVLHGWWYLLWNVLAAALLLGVGAAVGITPSALGIKPRRRTVVFAAIGAAIVLTGYLIALAIPPLRAAFHDTRIASIGLQTLLWAAVIRVPFGTVLLEEVAFRGVLPGLLGGGDRFRWRPVLGASVLFGLWHIGPAITMARTNAMIHDLLGSAATIVAPIGVVAAMTGAGIAMCAWRYAGRGLLASMSVHTATNSAGMLIGWALIHRF